MRSEAGTGEQEVQVIVNRDRASQLGLTTQDIALTVAGAMRGDRLPELRTSERELTMRLAFRESDRQSVEDLARVPVMLPDGSRTDLGAVADFVVKPSDREIQRLNRLTTVVIIANLTKGTTMDEVRKRVEPSWTPTRCRQATRGSSAAASRRTTRPSRPWRRTCCSPWC